MWAGPYNTQGDGLPRVRPRYRGILLQRKRFCKCSTDYRDGSPFWYQRDGAKEGQAYECERRKYTPHYRVIAVFQVTTLFLVWCEVIDESDTAKSGARTVRMVLRNRNMERLCWLCHFLRGLWRERQCAHQAAFANLPPMRR